ncbi:MAG: hypothetical protein P1V51_04645 [Deltaproteobacteria bacterium]|nr:hypothetical protein [Deltaproteobacteria bacterium]
MLWKRRAAPVAVISTLALAAGLAGVAACGAGDALGGGEYDQGADGGANFEGLECSTDLDCPAGLVCQTEHCVSPSDGRPPEVEETRSFLAPAASADHVFVLSPSESTVAVIDAQSLAIETVPLPEEPLALALLDASETLVVLSGRGEALSVVEPTLDPPRLLSQPVGRRFPALSLSPDGAWALLWTPDGHAIDAGAEGIVSLVDVDALAAGSPAPVLERAAGRRHTDVFFRREGLAFVEAVVVGSEEVAIIDLVDPAASPLPVRLPLPDDYTDLFSREVVPVAGGATLLVRSFTSPDLLILDIAGRTTTTLTLPAVPTDLDVSADGGLAVVALRAIGEVAWLPLPAGLTDPGLLQRAAITEVPPGQVTLAEDASFLVAFTTSEPSEALAWVELATGQVSVFDRLQKWVRTVGIAPGGGRAIVLHRPDPDSTVADPYEREVDLDEGYSLVDLAGPFAQLKRTAGIPPRTMVFTPDGLHAGVTLRDGNRGRIDAVDLETLVTDTLPLASGPQFSGALPAGAAGADRMWVTQDHAAGRISFVSLAERVVRTVTGYDLNAEIETP